MLKGDEHIWQDRILELIKDRKEEGMKQLFNHFFDELYNHSYKLTHAKEVSEDILQNVFYDLWLNAPRREIKNLRSYLYQMVRFQVYSYWSEKPDLTELVEEFNEVLYMDELNQILDAREVEENIQEAVKALPSACRNIFELSHFDGLSNREIAHKLLLSDQTVRNQLSKALRLVKKHLYVNKLLG
jgi:RNA polymerase sigma-70 factor (ECF subfamily)